MRQALRPNARRQRSTRMASIPPPVLGWNARDSIVGMDPRFALTLENYFPGTASVELRSGYESYATGVGTGNVETLICYDAATNKLLAAGGGSIYDATSAGAVPTALDSGKTNDRYQYVNFNGFAIVVNGDDEPMKYNGTTYDDIGDGAESAITAVDLTASDLINVSVFKERLFFTEKDTLNFWYLPVQQIGGTAVVFPLEYIVDRGGTLMATGSWTVDGGDGVNDVFVAVTSEGEVALYSGSDPGSDFALIGIYQMSPPIGRRCLMSLGGDIIVLTINGAVSLSRVLAKGREDRTENFTFLIDGAFLDVARLNKGDFGWQMQDYPGGNYALINYPVLSSAAYNQFVVNTSTGAWCKFSGQDGVSWAVCNDDLYFGGVDGVVYKADTGTADSAGTISGLIKAAFSDFEIPQTKDFKQVKPRFSSNVDIPVAIQIDVDYSDLAFTAQPLNVEGTAGAVWDAEQWDTAQWASGIEVSGDWYGVQGIGNNAALNIKTETMSATIEYAGADWLFEAGGNV